jgi:hypothetical protein
MQTVASRAGVDVLRHCVLEETGRRIHRSTCLGDPGATAVVIGMRVRDDQRLHRPVTPVLAIQRQRRRSSLIRHKRVDHNHAAVGLDERHIRQVEPSYLVDPACQLKQTVPGG